MKFQAAGSARVQYASGNEPSEPAREHATARGVWPGTSCVQVMPPLWPTDGRSARAAELQPELGRDTIGVYAGERTSNQGRTLGTSYSANRRTPTPGPVD